MDEKEYSLRTSLGDINNNLLIILYDKHCERNFYNQVCDFLKDKNLIFLSERDNYFGNRYEVNFHNDDSIVIALDQKNNYDYNTAIYSPYYNDNLANSDALTLAMQAGFNRHFSNKVELKPGIVTDDDILIPTPTENLVEEGKKVNYTTISFGGDILYPEDVADSIFDGLLRYNYFINNYNMGNDLLYRKEAHDDLRNISKRFKCKVRETCKYNNIKNDDISNISIFKNPIIGCMDVFNPEVEMLFDKDKRYLLYRK